MAVVSILLHTQMDQNVRRTAISRRLGEKFWRRRLANRVGRVIRNTGTFLLGLMEDQHIGDFIGILQ